ncbi:hypothetical protein C1634_006735 [Chryseobacterium viscerum]|uniref:Uncharacterized protein n=2 Tax=Chryseobacterium viscerum TaxID=1037377 RepID=A0A316WLZ7_9FLAO|nr:hypothetical protein C1634_006735 [Chryseobacterium viscerum]
MVLLYSCRNEQLTEQETYNNSSQFRPTSKTISLEESKHKLVLKTELQKAQTNLKEVKTNVSGKTIEYENSISIDTDNVKYIEYGSNSHTYTFNLVRENASEIASLENLVLSSLPDGTYKELLVTYNFTPQEKQDLLSGKGVKTAGKTTVIELAKGTYGGGVSNRGMGDAESCSYQTVDMYFSCYSGDHHQGNESTWGGCEWASDGGYPAQHLTVIALVCTASTALGDDGSPGGGDMGSTTGLGSGTNTPTIPTFSRFFFYVKKLPVDLKAVLYDTANTEFYEGLKTYYDVNFGSAEAGEFINWALQFQKDNPDVSWMQFQNWFINPDGISNLVFNNSINTSNSIAFNTKTDFKTALLNKNNVFTEGVVLQENGSEKIVSAKIKRTGIWGSGEEVRVKLKKINNRWAFDSVTSSELGLTLGVWSFTQIDYTQNTNANVLTVEVTGYENYNVFVEGLGTVYKDKVMIRIKINTTTGNIFSIEFIDL